LDEAVPPVRRPGTEPARGTAIAAPVAEAAGSGRGPGLPRANRASDPARGAALLGGLRLGRRARARFEEIGDMLILTGRTISAALRPPYSYGEEFVAQFIFALQVV